MTDEERSTRFEETTLDSWKAIAAHLKRDVRTVKRWEKLEGLPVHRHLHQSRSSVYAFPSEINVWSATRQPRREEVAAWRGPIPTLAFAAVLMLSLLLVADAPFSATAAAQQQPGMTSRRVWVSPPNGDLSSSAISPNGRLLTYTDWTTAGDLAVRDFTTGRDRVLSTRSNAFEYSDASAISRDGKQVAYSWENDDTHRYEIRVASLEGTGLPQSRLLFDNEDVVWLMPCDWSPDGNWLAVQLERKDRTSQMGLISVRDGSLRVLKSAEWQGATKLFFSPDGKYLSFDAPVGETANGQHDVFLLAMDGSREVPAVAGPSDDTMMGWSPDGKYLLFASDRSGTVGLWAVPIADGRPQGTPELIKSDIPRGSIGVSASGSLYFGVSLSAQDIHVASVDFGTGKLVSGPVKPIQSSVGFNTGPAWSPDGKYLAYISLRPPPSNDKFIGIHSVENGLARELKPKLTTFQNNIRWAPDGRSFLVSGSDLRGRQGQYRIDAQTGEVTPIAVVPDQSQSSPDGKRIYIRKNLGTDGISFVERDLASGNEREIFRRRDLGTLNISPDGRFLTTASNDESTKSSAVFLIPVSGGEPRELLRASQPQRVGGVGWMPDGQAVLVNKVLDLSRTQQEVLLFPIDGGQYRKIDMGTTQFGGPIKVHPDGKQIAFVAGDDKQEVWVLENFLPALDAKR